MVGPQTNGGPSADALLIPEGSYDLARHADIEAKLDSVRGRFTEIQNTPGTGSVADGLHALGQHLTGLARPVVISASLDQTVRVWDLATRKPIGAPFIGHTAQVNAVATTQLDGRPVVISGSYDETVRVWDLTARAHA